MTELMLVILILIGRMVIVASLALIGVRISNQNWTVRSAYFLGAASYISYIIAAYAFGVDKPSTERIISVYGIALMFSTVCYVLWNATKLKPKKIEEEKDC